jgi:hypothetical protein
MYLFTPLSEKDEDKNILWITQPNYQSEHLHPSETPLNISPGSNRTLSLCRFCSAALPRIHPTAVLPTQSIPQPAAG